MTPRVARTVARIRGLVVRFIWGNMWLPVVGAWTIGQGIVDACAYVADSGTILKVGGKGEDLLYKTLLYYLFLAEARFFLLHVDNDLGQFSGALTGIDLVQVLWERIPIYI